MLVLRVVLVALSNVHSNVSACRPSTGSDETEIDPERNTSTIPFLKTVVQFAAVGVIAVYVVVASPSAAQNCVKLPSAASTPMHAVDAGNSLGVGGDGPGEGDGCGRGAGAGMG